MSIFKNKKVNQFFVAVIGITATITIGGCGGGESSTASSTTLNGTFIDSPVVGLDYNCSSGSGITDSNGSFSYKASDTCTFSVGTLHLGSVKMVDANVTPSDIAEGNTTAIGNIASLLQSLDDHTLTGKIHLSSAIKNKLPLDLSIMSDAATFYTALDSNKSILGISTVVDSAKATVNMNTYLALPLSNTVITGKVINGIDSSRITFYANGIYYAEYLDVNGVPNGTTGAGTWYSKDGKTIYFTNNISQKTTVAKLLSANSASVTAPNNTTYTVSYVQTPISKTIWDTTESGLYFKSLSITSPGIDPARVLFNSNGTCMIAFLSGSAGSGIWSVGTDHIISMNISGQLITIMLNNEEMGTITMNGQTFPIAYILQ
jgi:hypothetical protein